jgi:hypothetical protein
MSRLNHISGATPSTQYSYPVMSTTKSTTFSEKVRHETKHTRIYGRSIDSDSSSGELGRRRAARATRSRNHTRISRCGSGRRNDRKRNRTGRYSSKRRNASLVLRCRGVRGTGVWSRGGNDGPRPSGEEAASGGDGDGGACLVGVGDGVCHRVARDRFGRICSEGQ